MSKNVKVIQKMPPDIFFPRYTSNISDTRYLIYRQEVKDLSTL